jgi:predicted secreted Zn-dependent protease
VPIAARSRAAPAKNVSSSAENFWRAIERDTTSAIVRTSETGTSRSSAETCPMADAARVFAGTDPATMTVTWLTGACSREA